MASAQDLSGWDKDQRLFLFTSLTAGSSHIITATSRLETILKANKVPFQAIDTATDDQARRLWGRRAGKKKLPGLVKEGYVIGDLEEVEEWNEYGELKENIGPVAPVNAAVPPGSQSAAHPAPAATKSADDSTTPVQSSLQSLNMKEAATQAANIGAARKDAKVAPSSLAEADAATKPETMNSSSAAKIESIRTAEDTSALASNAQPAAAPLSAVDSNKSGDTLSALAPPAGSTQQKHRGSSVSNADADEIKEVEASTAIPEADDEDENTTGDQPKTQAQESAAADKAPVSVED